MQCSRRCDANLSNKLLYNSQEYTAILIIELDVYLLPPISQTVDSYGLLQSTPNANSELISQSHFTCPRPAIDILNRFHTFCINFWKGKSLYTVSWIWYNDGGIVSSTMIPTLFSNPRMDSNPEATT